MFDSAFKYFAVILLVKSATAFVQYEDGKEYEFRFRSQLNLEPSYLTGQSVNATIRVRKFGSDASSLIVSITNSQASGKNIDSRAKGNIEGVFGVVRDESGAVTHIVTKSSSAEEILTKKNIVSMFSDDFSFFNNYVKNPASRKNRQRVELSIGPCESDISAETDDTSDLTSVTAQAQKNDCEVNPLILKAGQFLLQGTTKQIGQIKETSRFGMIVLFNTKSGQMVEVSKFTFLNLVLGFIQVQARHNAILEYIGEHPESKETEFEEPYSLVSTGDIDQFIRDQEETA